MRCRDSGLGIRDYASYGHANGFVEGVLATAARSGCDVRVAR